MASVNGVTPLSPGDNMVRGEVLKILKASLRQLSLRHPKICEALIRRYFLEQSVREICVKMHYSDAWVRNALHKGERIIRKSMFSQRVYDYSILHGE